MAVSRFRDCIVSLLDLNNVGALLAEEKGLDVSVMRGGGGATILNTLADVCDHSADRVLDQGL
jgi:hypothetical protein